MSLEDEAWEIVDRGGEFAGQSGHMGQQAYTGLAEDDHVREGVLDEQRLQRQSELVAILRKHKVATVPIYKGEGLFAGKVNGWVISGYRPGGSRGEVGEATEPALEIFGVVLCGDGICYAFRQAGKPRRLGIFGYGRRLMLGPTRPLRQRIQQEIAVRVKFGTFSANDCHGGMR